jgi:hypothetical protein
MGVTVKHQKLVRQVGVFIEDPPANSMTSFNFTSVVPDKSTTFVFSSWICTANRSGSFCSHFANTRELEVSTPIFCRDIDDLANDVGEI